MSIGVTLHGKFRFATRVLGMNFKDEKAYRDWQKKNQEEDAEIKRQILEQFEKCEFVYEGKIGDAENDSRYYVDLDNMTTFITSIDGESIITCYDIFFDMGKTVDKKTAKLMFKEIQRLQKQMDKKMEKVNKELETIDFGLKSTASEIERVEEILKNLKMKEANLQNQREVTTKSTIEMEYEISKLATKLCYSCQLKNDFLF